jgi:hypothetical protein
MGKKGAIPEPVALLAFEIEISGRRVNLFPGRGTTSIAKLRVLFHDCSGDVCRVSEQRCIVGSCSFVGRSSQRNMLRRIQAKGANAQCISGFVVPQRKPIASFLGWLVGMNTRECQGAGTAHSGQAIAACGWRPVERCFYSVRVVRAYVA